MLLFPWTIIKWNKLDTNYHKTTFNVFRSYLSKVARPLPNSIYYSNNFKINEKFVKSFINKLETFTNYKVKFNIIWNT